MKPIDSNFITQANFHVRVYNPMIQSLNTNANANRASFIIPQIQTMSGCNSSFSSQLYKCKGGIGIKQRLTAKKSDDVKFFDSKKPRTQFTSSKDLAIVSGREKLKNANLELKKQVIQPPHNPSLSPTSRGFLKSANLPKRFKISKQKTQ